MRPSDDYLELSNFKTRLRIVPTFLASEGRSLSDSEEPDFCCCITGRKTQSKNAILKIIAVGLLPFCNNTVGSMGGVVGMAWLVEIMDCA